MMTSYLRADLWRGFHTKARLILLTALMLVLAGILLYFRHDWVTLLEIEGIACQRVLPLVLGVVEMAFIVGDDFGAKTFQCAIGRGMRRRDLVVSKYFSISLFLLMDMAVEYLLFLAFYLCWGKSTMVSDLVCIMLICWFRMVVYMSIAMIPAFFLQGNLFGVMTYALLAPGVIEMLLNLFLNDERLQFLHLDRFLPGMILNKLYTQTLLGLFDPKLILIALLFVAGGMIATWYLFRDIELEF